MPNIREIKLRIRAVKNIQRITKTMQMIATAKLQAATRRAEASKPFTNKVNELVGKLAAIAGGEGSNITHPLLEKPEESPNKRLMLVLTANRGLCGGYNTNIVKEAINQYRELGGDVLEVEAVGRKGVSTLKYNKVEVTKAYSEMPDEPSFDDVNPIAEAYLEAYIEGKYDGIDVCYMKYLSRGVQKPVIETLLPMQPPAADEEEGGGAEEVSVDFSPEPEVLLAELLPLSFKTQFFQCFSDAKVSEHIARMTAMKAATDNASTMGKNLKRQYNRARQAKITTELIEIISASEAL